MYVRFWGTRGSIAAPGAHTAKYGGNTSCVEVRTDDGTIIVLDCGTGGRELGQYLVATTPQPLRLNLFFGHTHWDHIQGFPFFIPAFAPGTELNIYAPRGFQHNLEESLAGQMQYSYFPVRLRELRSHIHFTELEEGFFRVGDVLVETQHLNHTAPTIAYRITCDGATMAYVTDHEPFWTPNGHEFRHPGDQRHIAFLKNVDLVIHDAQYTAEEYPTKHGWGHSPMEYAADVAIAAEVRRLALFHHDPMREDDELARLEEAVQRRANKARSNVEIFAAAEGLTIQLRGTDPTPRLPDLSALNHRPIAGSQIMIVSANDEDTSAIVHELEEDNLLLSRVAGIKMALFRSEQVSPDLIIIDSDVPDGNGEDVITPLRAGLGRESLPIVLLTDRPETLHHGVGATDYLSKPFSPPLLRSRVRAWLARSSPEAPGLDVSGMERRHRSPAPSLTPSEVAEALSTYPLFRILSREHLEMLAAAASEQVFDPGQLVIQQGQVSDDLYVVLAGRARVVHASDGVSPVELMLGELSEGEIFGELGIVSDRPRSATVVAVELLRCLVLPRAAFQRVLESSAAFARELLQIVSSRLYDADRRLARYAPDPLTGLASRRAFLDLYPRMAAQAQRQQLGLMLIVLDVVHLKTINDSFGYAVGDEVLRTVADALTESARRTDLVARYGGDEFAVLLVDGSPNTEESVVKRVHKRLAELAERRRLPMQVECAIGVARSNAPHGAAEELFRQADRDMLSRTAHISVPAILPESRPEGE